MSVRVLLVEDSPADIFLTKRALTKAGYSDLEITEKHHGREAVNHLKQLIDTNQPLPSLVLLDWRMPILGGEGVLQFMKTDQRLQRIPVIILTTSKAEVDVNRAYQLMCSAYVMKPASPQDFDEAIKNLGLFWLKTSILPNTQTNAA